MLEIKYPVLPSLHYGCSLGQSWGISASCPRPSRSSVCRKVSQRRLGRLSLGGPRAYQAELMS
jgi:hypothetical protein